MITRLLSLLIGLWGLCLICMLDKDVKRNSFASFIISVVMLLDTVGILAAFIYACIQ